MKVESALMSTLSRHSKAAFKGKFFKQIEELDEQIVPKIEESQPSTSETQQPEQQATMTISKSI
eukprot:3510386-Pyramimonas_sp.AAC.1